MDISKKTGAGNRGGSRAGKNRIKKAASVFLAALFLCLLPFSASAVSVKRGDANMDGEVTVDDSRQILRYAVKLDACYQGHIKICDVNNSGAVDVNDARAVLRHCVKLDTIDDSPVEVTDEELQPPSEDELLGDLSKYPLPTVPANENRPGYFRFVVYGDGHGIGLSQYGAVYMAEKGCTYKYILSHYFPGTEIRFAETIPEKTVYVGEEYDTMELLCRMVAQEVGGIIPPLEALKAQTVAIFTLLKKYDYNVGSKWDVATIADKNSSIWKNSWCQNTLIPTVMETVGQYLVRTNDPSNEEVLTVYSRMAAGATVNCKDEWWDSYPVSVKSPFEMTQKDFVSVHYISAADLKSKIIQRDIATEAELGSDPSKWIKILSHTASIDKNRGYVTDILVGGTVLSKVGTFSEKLGLGFESGCFTVEYTK